MMCGKEASDVHCQSARCSSEDEVSVRADETVPRNVSKKEVIITLIKTASPIPSMLPLPNPGSALAARNDMRNWRLENISCSPQ